MMTSILSDSDSVCLRLSREERKSYLDEADRFYQDPEGFIQGIPELPQRLVFFDSLAPRLEGIRPRYLEVILPEGSIC